jgi:hypothetical protein
MPTTPCVLPLVTLALGRRWRKFFRPRDEGTRVLNIGRNKSKLILLSLSVSGRAATVTAGLLHVLYQAYKSSTDYRSFSFRVSIEEKSLQHNPQMCIINVLEIM